MHPWPWGLLTAGPSWFHIIKQNADIGSELFYILIQIPSKLEKKRAFVLCLFSWSPQTFYLYIFSHPSFWVSLHARYPLSRKRGCNKSRTSYISCTTQRSQKLERDLIPNYTPWWGAMVSMRDSPLETIDREAFLSVEIVLRICLFLWFSTSSHPFSRSIARSRRTVSGIRLCLLTCSAFCNRGALWRKQDKVPDP